MKVYCVMLYYSEEYHLGDIYTNKEEAEKVADRDLMHFDYVEEREVK